MRSFIICLNSHDEPGFQEMSKIPLTAMGAELLRRELHQLKTELILKERGLKDGQFND